MERELLPVTAASPDGAITQLPAALRPRAPRLSERILSLWGGRLRSAPEAQVAMGFFATALGYGAAKLGASRPRLRAQIVAAAHFGRIGDVVVAQQSA